MAVALSILLPLPGRSARTPFPVKPVRVIVPFSPGASTDIVARLLAQKLAEVMGQQFIVDNRAGAAGAVGVELVAPCRARRLHVAVTNPGPSLNAILLRRKPSYGFADFSPIVNIASAPVILVANAKFPASNVYELVAVCESASRQSELGFLGHEQGSARGAGSAESVTGVDIVHVPDKGSGPALTDVIGWADPSDRTPRSPRRRRESAAAA